MRTRKTVKPNRTTSNINAVYMIARLHGFRVNRNYHADILRTICARVVEQLPDKYLRYLHLRVQDKRSEHACYETIRLLQPYFT